MRISSQTTIQLLQRGEAVAIPTDTVYGIAALYWNECGIKKIFTLKNRKRSKPLIVFIASLIDVYHFTSFVPEIGWKLIHRYWPGALTLILPAKEQTTHALIRGSQPFIGIRIPRHPTILHILHSVGPLVATSINQSGQPPLQTIQEIENVFGAAMPILEDPILPMGKESSIVSYMHQEWQIMREGAISKEELLATIRQENSFRSDYSFDK